MLPLLLLCACAPLRPLLDHRNDPFAGLPGHEARSELARRCSSLADRLVATAAFYDREADKAHLKMRVMSVLVGVGATGAGASIGALSQPEFPDAGRPGVASLGVSMAVFSGLMAILPHAHQYILKEAGYRHQATQAREALVEIDEACALAMLEADRPLQDLAACADRLQDSLAAALRFPEGSPCRPPPEDELAAAIRRALR